MKSSNNSGPGLAITAAVIGGGLSALWLASHGQAWPHALIASAMIHAGHPSTHLMRAGIGGAVAAVLALIPGLYLEERLKTSQRRAAARRAAREAEEAEVERGKMSGAAAQVDTRAIIDAELGRTIARPANQATAGFIASMLAGAGVIFFAAYFFLTHS